jgi:putative membrane protein
MLTLAGAALLITGTAMAQSTTGQGGTNPTAGGMNSAASQQNQQMAQQNQQMAMNSGSTASAGSMQDKKFAKAAMAGGMAEVQLGQLALQKASSDDVKQFAQRMIDDHTKLNDQMKPIAAQVGVQPPTALMPKDQKVMEKLQGLQGNAFDQAYIKDMVKDHMEDDQAFQKEASSGQNPQEKEAAQQGDQVIKQHLQMIEGIAKTHNIAVKGM